MLDAFLRGDFATAPTPLSVFGLSLLLALLLGQAIAWVYMATHNGLSYSRAFVVSLALLPMIVALVMMVLANSLVVAFGLMAVFAIVRFRNVVRDTLDTVHVLATIVMGMACGTQKFTTAVIGGGAVLAAVAYFKAIDFGRRQRHNYIVHLRWMRPAAELPLLLAVLARHTRRCRCAAQRSTPDGQSSMFSYHVQLRDPARTAEFLAEVGALAGATDVAGLPAEDESEV